MMQRQRSCDHAVEGESCGVDDRSSEQVTPARAGRHRCTCLSISTMHARNRVQSDDGSIGNCLALPALRLLALFAPAVVAPVRVLSLLLIDRRAHVVPQSARVCRASRALESALASIEAVLARGAQRALSLTHPLAHMGDSMSAAAAAIEPADRQTDRHECAPWRRRERDGGTYHGCSLKLKLAAIGALPSRREQMHRVVVASARRSQWLAAEPALNTALCIKYCNRLNTSASQQNTGLKQVLYM